MTKTWGNAVWNDGTLWGGETSTGTSMLWDISVDWNEDGEFDNFNEAAFLTGVKIKRGNRKLISLSGNGFENPDIGSAVLVMNNSDGRFSEWNTNSPLYPYAVPGKKIRIRNLNQSTGIINELFRGIITSIAIDNFSEKKTATITASDGWRYLQDRRVSVPLEAGITPTAAIRKILEACLWPDAIDFSPVGGTIPYWWTSNTPAMKEIASITDSFLIYAFIRGDGTFRVVDNSVASVPHTEGLLQPQLAKRFEVSQPYEYFRPRTRIVYTPLTLLARTVIYQSQGTPAQVLPGETLTFTVQYTYNSQQVAAQNIVAAVPHTDYSMNSNFDGSGTDLTSDFTVAFNDKGTSCECVIVSASASTAHITLLQIRGEPFVRKDKVSVVYSNGNETAQNANEFVLDAKWLQDANRAYDFANTIGPFMARPKKFLAVKMENRPQQFSIDLYDIVAMTAYDAGISGESFRVIGLEHSDSGHGNCQVIITTFYLQPLFTTAQRMLWDTLSVWDTETIFGY